MAHITVFETNPIDQFQLQESFKHTDHYLEFIEGPIRQEAVNQDTEVLSVFVASSVTREVLALMPKLKLIATRSTGFDHIDIDYAMEHNITVVNVPTYGENTVAEHAFALLLAITKKIVPTVQATYAGNFVANQHIGVDLQSKTLGIIGLGHIGAHAARIGVGFGMEVLGYDLEPSADLAQSIGFSYVELSELLARSDVISLHVPSTAANYHMINQHTIEQMKPGAIIINTSRAELIENRALLGALASGRLSGVGLDTLEGEHHLMTGSMLSAIENNATAPELYEHIAESQLLMKHPNVIITPHVAFNTTEAIERINTTTANNIHAFIMNNPENVIASKIGSGKLVIIRHGTSEWNKLGKWTGSTDVHLTHEAIEESARLGEVLRDIPFDYAYTSQQIRTRETLEALMNGSNQLGLAHEPTKSLNERDYGMFTGMNKESILETIGQEAFDELRRGWDSPVEGGESLRDVYNRVVPYYLRIILPRLRHGQNVLVVAHGNSIRSLIKYIENVSDSRIGDVSMEHNVALVYTVDSEGRKKRKETLTIKDSPLINE